MERRFHNEDFDFEQLIKQKADHHKIYPSSRVWKNIYRSLHPTSKWYWFSVVLFLSGISYYALEKLNVAPAAPNQVAKNVDQVSNENSVPSEKDVLPFILNTLPDALGRQAGDKSNGALVLNMQDYLDKQNVVNKETNSELTKENTTIYPKSVEPVNPVDLSDSKQVSENIVFADPGTAANNAIASDMTEKGKQMQAALIITPTVMPETKEQQMDEENDKRINWLQEYAVIELVAPKTRRLSWQVSLTPTMNYRKLYGNKDATIGSDAKNIPMSLNIAGDIDNLVNHKPAIGFEAGSAVLYTVDKNLSFKAGLLFNYSQYDIEAFSSSSTEIATIALNGNLGIDADSLTSYTSIRNFGGYAEKQIHNEYFQLSMPIGAEFVVLGGRRLQFAIAGTVQPTYVLNRDNYMITTDYKNYTREPSLARRWNMNTSAEAFVSYKAAGMKFQIGPQFRYQVFSSYDNEYPVKEYLMEYGVKFGVSKTFR